MALINCPHCGAKISDKAPKCPKCGADPTQRVEEKHITEETHIVEEDSTQQNHEEPSTKRTWSKVWIIVGVLTLIVGGVCVFLFTQRDKQSITSVEAGEENIVEITPSFIEAMHQFDELYPFSEGLAAVKKDGKFGYINTKGDLVIPCQFDKSCAFSEGLAIVMDEEYNIGIITKDGIKTSTQYKLDVLWYGTGGWHYDKGYYSFGFINNECLIKTDGSEEEIVIDPKGAIITQPSEYPNLAVEANHTDTICYEPILVKYSATKENIYHNEEIYYGIKDSSNKILAQPQYYQIGEFHNGVAQIVIFVGQAETKGIPYGIHMPDGEYFFGYIDTKGNTTFTQSDFEEIETYKKEQLKVSSMALDVESLIKRIGNDAAIRDDWESQLVSIGFIREDRIKVYEGEGEYGDEKMIRYITKYKLGSDIPIITISYDEAIEYDTSPSFPLWTDSTFNIVFNNQSLQDKFIESLKVFGYSEETNDGKRMFSSIKGNNCPGIYWIVEENRIYSGNSQC